MLIKLLTLSTLTLTTACDPNLEMNISSTASKTEVNVNENQQAYSTAFLA